MIQVPLRFLVDPFLVLNSPQEEVASLVKSNKTINANIENAYLICDLWPQVHYKLSSPCPWRDEVKDQIP